MTDKNLRVARENFYRFCENFYPLMPRCAELQAKKFFLNYIVFCNFQHFFFVFTTYYWANLLVLFYLTSPPKKKSKKKSIIRNKLRFGVFGAAEYEYDIHFCHLRHFFTHLFFLNLNFNININIFYQSESLYQDGPRCCQSNENL